MECILHMHSVLLSDTGITSAGLSDITLTPSCSLFPDGTIVTEDTPAGIKKLKKDGLLPAVPSKLFFCIIILLQQLHIHGAQSE